jgi:CheY-like chemotaxis protein
MRLLLEGWGCHVRIATGRTEILATDQQLPPPDVVLADYHLDGETGLHLIRDLRLRWGVATPAILVTADRSSEVRTAAGEADISVINKPLKPAALRSLMSRIRKMAQAAE